ncbi:Uncharacterized protein new4 at N-terminal half [Coccomyxa sp. Obi]|nr:Uncharacterized protein new4 at N-terminal half [Coccomyxa sp. Obi]
MTDQSATAKEAQAPKRQRLEIPSVPTFERRLQFSEDRSAPQPIPGALLPPSSVLERVKAFLPSMQQANEQLQHTLANQPEAVDIETVEEGRPHIEMDLACGVLDLKDERAVSAAEKSLHNGQAAEDWLPGHAEKNIDEDEDEDSQNDGSTVAEGASRAHGQHGQMQEQKAGQKGLPKRAGIVELNEHKG